MVYWWKIVCTFSYISKLNIIKSVRNHSKAVQWVTNLSLKLDELCICDFQNSIYEKEIWDISYRCNLLEVRVFLQMQFVSSDSLKALANEDPFCRYKCFPVCPRAQHLLRTQILCPGQQMFQNLFRNILCPQQMFPSLRSPRNIMDNNVSATMRPCLPGP